jgi:DNA replication protein DnaC
MNQPRKGNRLFKDFRCPDPDKYNVQKIAELKKRFIELIRNEFLEVDKPFEITDELKPKLLFIFNWILGIDVNLMENKGLQLAGEIGLGKSCILKATHNLICELYACNSKYITANKLARLFRNSDEDSEIKINQLIFCHLLFIDDIGTEDIKVYDSFPIQEIIRERYDKRKITSFTTNKNPSELISRYTASIEDKLNHGTYRIEFKGTSKR